MGKKVYFIDNKYLVQKRLQRISLPTTSQRIKTNLWKYFSSYFLASLILLFLIFLILVILTSEYELDGTHKANDLLLEKTHVLGVDSLGRDNLILFSVSWINVVIYLLLTLSIALAISVFLVFFLIRYKELMRLFQILRKYEGMLILPVLLIVCALFLDNSYSFFVLMSAIPAAFSISHEISFNWKKQKLANYYQVTYNTIHEWRNTTIVRWILIVIRSFSNVAIRSLIYLLFWEFQFSYLELIVTYNSFLIGNTNTLGAYIWNNLDLLLVNSKVLIIGVVSFVLLLSFLSIIYLNKKQKNMVLGANNYDKY